MNERIANILLIDDQLDNLRTLSSILQERGFNVRQALSGELALKTVQADLPDLILLDIRMPKMDGYEVCAALKSAELTHDIPVIFLSALDDTTDKLKAFELGGADYITKPFQAEEVIARIQRELTIQRQKEQLTQQNEQLQVAEVRLQQFNSILEQQIQERTIQLNRALEYDARLKRITDKVRDTLDEVQVLQTAVKELASILDVERCCAAIYPTNPANPITTYEYRSHQAGVSDLVLTEQSHAVEDRFSSDYLQPCLHEPDQIQQVQIRYSVLTCSIVDDQRVLGELSLSRSPEWRFDDLEVRLVRQVANQCAIAIRQARLYAAAQLQVEELEKLNRLKDDFLSTVSHELRTPVANIKVIADLLNALARQEPAGLAKLTTKMATGENKLSVYAKILQEECDRELRLLQDFLDLQILEAGSYPMEPATVNLQEQIPRLLEAFAVRANKQGLAFNLELATDLPPLTTDWTSLSRILVELANNACKYTPPQGTITVAATVEDNILLITVSNSGVTIVDEQRERIFDKFYRIPDNDPWKHGGTGLGLALVKRLVEHINGEIDVQSQDDVTQFIIRLSL